MEVDVVVIGAGAVGLAVAAAFARSGRETLVLEAMNGVGTATSSRKSEVIHAGMYYPTGSLRHRMCVTGRRRLYQYLVQRSVPHQRCGKLIVATSDAETEKVENIRATGIENGVEGLELISGSEAMAKEPNLYCATALWSPETGIIDSHATCSPCKVRSRTMAAQSPS
jgi:L-2-hydroxyglutarate oxidase LhgO